MQDKTKIAIYDRYLSTLGGGERYSCKIAEILSADNSNEVDIITDINSSLSDVSKRLSLDLDNVKLKVFPFISDDYAEKITGGYDIFINATYLSALTAKSKYNLYVCYFPTPFDVDFSLIHRLLLIFFRIPAVFIYRKASDMIRNSFFEIEEGIYDVKRFLLRRGSWSGKKAVIKINCITGSTSTNSFTIGLKNPKASGINEMNIEIKNTASGKVFFEKELKIKLDEKLSLLIPLKKDFENIIEISSETFIPSQKNQGAQDSRDLGAVLYDENKISHFKKTVLKIIGFMPLFLVAYPSDLKFLKSYDEILSISQYSSSWIDKLWKRKSTILFPPVDVQNFYQSPKEKIILSAGRFFPQHHNKKQLELAQTFIELFNENKDLMEGYSLYLLGGLENKKAHLDYVEKIREISKGYPIYLKTNISWDELRSIFAKASIFWHASGMGEDEEKHPEKFEHFGITTVEAMAAGCVCVVIGKGGQEEIIKDGINGFTFDTFAKLKEKTLEIAADPEMTRIIRSNAKKDSEKFSNKVFEESILNIIQNAKKVLKNNT